MLLVEDVVASLCPSDWDNGHESETLPRQIDRAARQFNLRKAHMAVRLLLGKIEDGGEDIAELESFVVLCLAHPGLLTRYRLPAIEQARRLALRLERAEESERAQELLERMCVLMPTERGLQHELAGLMRRLGKTDELVERYLGRAEEAVGRKNTTEAIGWLQESLMVDRSRRDVARMIRDLRYEEAERYRRSRSRRQRVVLTLLLASLAGIGAYRERSLNARFRSIEQAAESDLAGLRDRLLAIDSFIQAEPLWLGAFAARSERNRLRTQIDVLEARQAERKRLRLEVEEANLAAAESARLRARESVHRRDFETALKEFQEALEIAPENWEQRERTVADIQAIEEHLGANR
jgi:tetratricopeptide (TPR) repeat protein